MDRWNSAYKVAAGCVDRRHGKSREAGVQEVTAVHPEEPGKAVVGREASRHRL